MKKKFQAKKMIVDALHHENNGRYEESLQVLNEIINSNPKNSEAYANRGRVKILFLNQIEEGIKDLDEATSLDLNKYFKFEAYILRGYAKLKLMKYQEALDDFKRQIVESKNAKKDLCASYSGSCIAKKHLGLEQEAGEEYAVVRELRYLNNVFDLLLRGEAHELFGNRGAASEDYRAMLRLKTNYKPAIAALDRMAAPTASVQHTSVAPPGNTSATSAQSHLPNILKEIKTNYEFNHVGAGEILKKFEQLLNEYPAEKEEIILSRADFHFYMASKSTNKTQREFILQNAQTDYKSVLAINCYNQTAVEGLGKVESLLLQANNSVSSPGFSMT